MVFMDPHQKPSTAYTADAAYEALLSKKAEEGERAKKTEESEQAELDLASIFTMDARKLNAMWKAWKRRNRISKAIRIVIANIVAVPVYALFDKAGLGWASWLVAIVVMVYSLIILVSPGTPDALAGTLGKVEISEKSTR